MGDEPGTAPSVEQVGERLAEVWERVRRAGGSPEVRIVGVTKGQPPPVVRAALAAGITELGENYAQALLAKAAEVGDGPLWHFIGHLQTNKVRLLAPVVACYQSVDRTSVVEELSRRVPAARAFVQVDLAGTEGRAGCRWEDVAGVVDAAIRRGLVVEGLMGVAAPIVDAGSRRSVESAFRRLGDLRVDLGLRELSIGMSGDFELAVSCGATLLRLGTVLFGDRG